MSEEFTKPLISSINASARFGVTNDYVARLCRKREVKGSLLGRTWYVDPDSLGEYLRAMHVKKEQKKISLSRDIQKWKQDHSLSRHTKSTSEPAMQRTESSPNAAHRKLEEIKKYFGVTSSVYPTLLHRSLTLSNAKRFLFASAILFFFSLSVTIGKFLPLPPGQEQFVARESTSAASALSQVFDFFFSKGTQNSQLRNNTTTQILPSKGSQNQYSQSGSQSAPTIIQQQVYPIRERTLVRVVSGVSEEHLTSRLSQLANTLRTEFSLYANVPTVPFPSLSGVMNAISLSQRIDKLSSVEITGGSITGATITGGSVTATSFSGILQISSGGTGTSSAPTYGKLLVGQSDGSYTLMSTSSLGITGGGTIDGSGSTNLFAYWDDADTLGATSSPAVGYIVATSTTASSTLMGGLAVNSSIKTNIIDCSEALETNAAGFLVCGSDATSAGQANPFTWAANYGVIAAATSSAFWAQAGVFASSTSHFANVDFINATTTSLYIGTLNGPLQANQGRVSATTSIGVLYGGTGLTTAPSYGQLLVGNSSGGYSLLSTSTLGLLASSSLSATAPLSYNSQTGAFTITQATASTDGYLSSAHWNAFNNKISSTSLS
ncbi:MAG TPA: hypothetical protein VD928_02120, partial [Candidatus Paceibacterota bacterium]|nr:hypothetical protein [Candidatus Paceibacterota bacterium]